ncbi:hypothetical protein [Agaribacter flavus]|uniref:Uncharacterized protein n=1 Tax=Agaribacter flavus TaxID=1902781 RepID=A0ABV7FWV5_9ALTE
MSIFVRGLLVFILCFPAFGSGTAALYLQIASEVPELAVTHNGEDDTAKPCHMMDGHKQLMHVTDSQDPASCCCGDAETMDATSSCNDACHGCAQDGNGHYLAILLSIEQYNQAFSHPYQPYENKLPESPSKNTFIPPIR